jgi:hypothetical protein
MKNEWAGSRLGAFNGDIADLCEQSAAFAFNMARKYLESFLRSGRNSPWLAA